MPLLAPPPEDRFWGSGAEAGARFCLFGAPLDLTGSGPLGTGKAPPAVRRASHNIESYSPTLDGDLFDAGPHRPWRPRPGRPADGGGAGRDRAPDGRGPRAPEPSPPGPFMGGRPCKSQGSLSRARERGWGEGRPVPIVVGGEHTIALAIGRAVKRRYPDAVIISLDAHLDLADELDGRKVAHGTWACRLGEELGGFGDFVLLGMRSGTRDEWQRSKGCLWQSPEVSLPDERRVGDRRPARST